MMGLSVFLSKLLRVGIVIAVFLFFTLVSFAPIAQQTSSPQPFPSAIILYPQPFEEIRDQTVFIVSMVSIHEEIADEYFLSGLFVCAGDEWLIVYPLQDEMIYDPVTKLYTGYYLSIWEPESEGVQTLLLGAVFTSSQPNTSPILSTDFRIVPIYAPSTTLSCPKPNCGPRPPDVDGWDPICFVKQTPCDGNCFGYCFDEMGCIFKSGPCDGECWGYCFGEPTGPIPPDDGTSPPNDGGTKTPNDDDNNNGDDSNDNDDDSNNNDDDNDNNNGNGCSGISYSLYDLRISGRIVQPSEEEVIVSAGDTMTLKRKVHQTLIGIEE